MKIEATSMIVTDLVDKYHTEYYNSDDYEPKLFWFWLARKFNFKRVYENNILYFVFKNEATYFEFLIKYA